MAPAAALISAVLASQVFSGLATSCGAKESAQLPCQATNFAQTLAMCSCTDLGMVNELGSVECPVSSANNDCGQTCCKASTTASCYGGLSTNAISCGTGKRFVFANAAAASGATATEIMANCCEDKPTITCADIDCKAGNTDNLKKKSGIDATAVADGTCCASAPDDCEACCEKDTDMCYNGATAGKACAADHVFTAMTEGGSLTAAGKVTFSDDANFKIQCCEAQATCTASPTCPAYAKAKTTMPTGKCAGAICDETECCEFKDNMCYSYGGCGPDMTLDLTAAMGGSAYAAGATDEVKKAACCKVKTTKPAETCQIMFDAVAASKAAATKATSSGAEGASSAMVVLAAIAAVSL